MQSDKNRTKTRVAVYLLIVVGDKILLGKRINAEHMNNHWSLPAGHVFEGESLTNAMIREAYEECGLSLRSQDIFMIGSLYQFSDSYDYANYIFKINVPNVTIINMEPEKCERFDYFDVHDLPIPIDPYVRYIIEKSVSVMVPWIDEYGFSTIKE